MAQNFQYMFEFVIDNLLLTPIPKKSDNDYEFSTSCELSFRSSVFAEINEKEYGSCVDLCAPKRAKSCTFTLEQAVNKWDYLRIQVNKKYDEKIAEKNEKSKTKLGVGWLACQPLFERVTTEFEDINPAWLKTAIELEENNAEQPAKFRTTSALSKHCVSLFDESNLKIGTLTLTLLLVCNGPVIMPTFPATYFTKTNSIGSESKIPLTSKSSSQLRKPLTSTNQKSTQSKSKKNLLCKVISSTGLIKKSKTVETEKSFKKSCPVQDEVKVVDFELRPSSTPCSSTAWDACRKLSSCEVPSQLEVYDDKYVPSSCLLRGPICKDLELSKSEIYEMKFEINSRHPRLSGGDSVRQSKEQSQAATKAPTEASANADDKKSECCCCCQFACPSDSNTCDETCCEEESESCGSACEAPCFMEPSHPDPGPDAYEEFEACLNGSALTIRVLKDTHKMDAIYDGTEGNMDDGGSDCGCNRCNRAAGGHDCCESLEQILDRSPYARNSLRRRTGGCIVNHPKIPKVRANIKYAAADIGCMEGFRRPFGKMRDQCRGLNKLNEYRKRHADADCDCGPIVPPRPMDDTRSCCLQVDPQEITTMLQGNQVDGRKKGIQVCYKTCEDADSDVFLVKLGAKKPCERKLHSVEIELKTPRIPIPCPVQKCTTETQVKESEIDSAMGGAAAGGKGKKGKKGKK